MLHANLEQRHAMDCFRSGSRLVSRMSESNPYNWHSHHPLWSLWCTMVYRCHNDGSKDYPNYGARGILVCDRWRKFKAFESDMSPRPSKQHTLDRIDNTKGYFPENVRWATWEQQAANRSNSLLICVGSEWLPPRLAAEQLRVSASVVYAMVKRGQVLSRRGCR